MLDFSPFPQTVGATLRNQALVTKTVAPTGGHFTTLGAALAAASSGWTIAIQPGLYYEPYPITSKLTNISIIGHGPESTILKFDSLNFAPNGAGWYIQGCQFSFTTGAFQPNSTKGKYFFNHIYGTDPTAIAGVVTITGTQAQFCNNYVSCAQTTAHNQVSTGSANQQILNNYFDLQGGQAATAISFFGNFSQFNNNWCNFANSGSDTSSVACLLASSTQQTLVGNTIVNLATGSDARGIWMNGSFGMATGNNIRNCWTGIYVAGTGVCVTGNYISQASTTSVAGIYLSAQGGMATGNVINGANGGTTEDGILVANSDITVTGNLIMSCYNGIHITAGNPSSIVGNEIQSSGNLAISDNLAGSLVIGNTNVPITARHDVVQMTNTSGGTLAAGSVVILKSVAAMNEINSTTTAGDAAVLGVIPNAITSTSVGSVYTEGKVTAKVDGTGTAIAIGDPLSCHTTAGVLHKAVSGEQVIARAMAASSSANSISVLVVQPFKL